MSATTWTVLAIGDHLGFILDDGSWGDSRPEKAKQFVSFDEVMKAVSDLYASHPKLTQVRLIASTFTSQPA